MTGETLWIWGTAGGVVLVVFLTSLVSFRRRLRNDRARLEEAVRLGIDRPQAQYPLVDLSRCIGCGTCVAACPEGDVLGLVGGKAVVINGFRCVGHALCEEACPVGAIEVGLGSLEHRDDIPRIDEYGETHLPGLFVIGELGGLSLIRNAVRQGRGAVARILDRQRPRASDDETLELLIVGAGPAGLAAGLAAQAAGLSYRILEKEASLGGTLLHYPRRKLVLTQPLELPLAGTMRRSEYTKEELLESFSGFADRFGLRFAFGEKVESVDRSGERWTVRTATREWSARSVILALGRRGTPRRLGVEGEESAQVLYRLEDAASYAGERLLCVGGGDSAVEAAIGLASQPGTRVALSYRRDRLVRIRAKNQERLDRAVAAGQVELLLPSTVEAIREGSVLLTVGGERRELANDFVFVMIGGEPPFPLLRKAGVRFGGASDPEGERAPERKVGT